MPGRSPLYAELEVSARGAFRKLEVAKLRPWLAMLSARSPDSEDYAGRRLGYSGIAFSGAPRQMFWGFFDPFLRDVVIDAVRQAVALADERCIDGAAPLADVAALLKGCVGGFHVRMSRMDACLQRAACTA